MDWQNILSRLRSFFRTIETVQRSLAVETVEQELAELENIFALLVFGSFVGIPSPPMQITLELLPEMETELIGMIHKIDTASAPLSMLFSTLDIG